MSNSEMPAMPTEEGDSFSSGLTKREHFAGLAMQGLLALSNGQDETYEELAVMSVANAEALLEELEK